MHEELRARWIALWDRIGAQGDPLPPFEDLVSRYSEYPRHYHGLPHLAHCFREFDEVRDFLHSPNCVEFALFAHDVVYDSTKKNNEALSAAWATEVLDEAMVGPSFIDECTGLVLVTDHTTPPWSRDDDYIVDIDLAILGQLPETFDAYEANIRREYGWVSEAPFVKGRIEVLRKFHKRSSVFRTIYFHSKYEFQAQENLKRSLLALGRNA